MEDQSFVKLEVEKGIGRLTFYHEKKNSMPALQLKRLAEAVAEASERSDIKVIVLQSAGDSSFCAGASFDELVAISNKEEGLVFFSGFANVINAMRKCKKFIIGRIQGKAVGGGVGLASAVDYCFAHESASVKLSELAVGIGPFVVGPAVERKMGLSAFSDLAIDAASWKSAHWAREKGLYNGVYATHQEMDEAVEKLAKSLANSSPEAMQHLKEVAWESAAHWDDLLIERAAISGKLVLSDYTRNAIQAFKQR